MLRGRLHWNESVAVCMERLDGMVAWSAAQNGCLEWLHRLVAWYGCMHWLHGTDTGNSVVKWCTE
jgi:hypothetical protein